MDKLKSCFCMSQNQAEAAVDIETANKMFGQNWNYHDEGDEDTILEKKNCRSVRKCIEAMALRIQIVKEVVFSGEQSTVTYANDGSKKLIRSARYYCKWCVQSSTYIEHCIRVKSNLAELKLTAL